jgi:hypothetical protein
VIHFPASRDASETLTPPSVLFLMIYACDLSMCESSSTCTLGQRRARIHWCVGSFGLYMALIMDGVNPKITDGLRIYGIEAGCYYDTACHSFAIEMQCGHLVWCVEGTWT